MCMCMSVSVYVWAFVCEFVYVFMYVFMCVCLYVCTRMLCIYRYNYHIMNLLMHLKCVFWIIVNIMKY